MKKAKPNMNKNMNRRLFLRGLGGAAVAAPFLTSVVERSAKAQTAGSNTLIVMFTHYGCLTDKWFPTSSHGPLAAADLNGLTIDALAPFVNKITIPRGIRAMNEWNAQMSRGQGNDPHTQVVGSYFTCQPVTPNSNDPFSFDSATKFNAMPIGPSLDHVAAAALNTTPLFMRVSGRNDSAQSAISYSEAETIYPGIGTVSQAYSNITGLFGAGGGGVATEDDYQAVKGKSILDLVRADLESLERNNMSQSDKLKLEAWKDLLNETGKVVAAAQCNEDLAAQLGLTTQGGGGGGAGGGDISTKVGGTDLDGADLFSNIAVLAAVCKASPVIFLKYPGNYVFGGLDLDMENHSISHRIGNAGMGGNCVAGVNDWIEKLDRYNTAKFAHLIGTLDGIAEGDGTALDATATVWFQEMSDGNAHNLNNLPIIHAGSAGGYFKMGQIINLDGGDANLSRGNSVGPCETDGKVTGTNTGTDAKFGNAPINKYYCNLMNAIGVKAGADGYAAADGTGEVTHFGRHDKTEDFIGGNKPVSITNPGQYTELLA